MTTSNLLLVLCGLLVVIGGLLPRAFKQQQSLPNRCFIFGLGAVSGVLLAVACWLLTTPQDNQNLDYLSLVIGYAFSLPTALYLLTGKPSNNSQPFRKTALTTSRQKLNEWRRELLKILETDVNVRLDNSLCDRELMPLLREDLPKQVGQHQQVTLNCDRASLKQWLQPERSLEVFSKSKTQLDSNDKIIEVFERDDIAGRLLILGAPGGGKTTTLLELARNLIQRAQQQNEHPIPVLFELSDWKDDQQGIADWLAANLKFRHNIPETITREWIKKSQLLPLLDGLDELGLTRQTLCIQKINEFLQASSGQSSLVVCCRQQEYIEGKVIINKLRGAVYLQPLSEQQIEDYLKQLECGHLWQLLKDDPEGLLELAKVPLLLRLIPVAYPEGLKPLGKHFSDPTKRQEYQEKCRQELLDAYVKKRGNTGENHLFSCEAMRLTHHATQTIKGELGQGSSSPLSRSANTSKPQGKPLSRLHREISARLLLIKRRLEQPHDCQGFPEEDTKRWLIWLATTLQERKQTEFCLEHMQPDLLKTLTQKWIYRLIGALITGMVSGLIGWLMFGRFLIFNFSLFGALIFLFNKKIEPVKSLKFSGIKAIFGLSIGIIFSLIFSQVIAKTGGLIIVLFSGITGSLYFGLNGDKIQSSNQPNQGIKESAKNVVRISLMNLPAGLLVFGWMRLPDGPMGPVFGPLKALIIVLGVVLFLGISSGGLPVIQHFVLRLILWRSGSIPWNYAHFLGYAAGRRLIEQVGGRYRFIHYLLREHFAQMPDF